MNTPVSPYRPGVSSGFSVRGTLMQARDWLDQRGRPGWIVAMILGFVLFWPLGLAILGYMIWSKRMSCNGWGRRAHHRHAFRAAAAPTGNAAFDAYRADTLKRLEEEREAFTTFLDQLRQAKDKGADAAARAKQDAQLGKDRAQDQYASSSATASAPATGGYAATDPAYDPQSTQQMQPPTTDQDSYGSR